MRQNFAKNGFNIHINEAMPVSDLFRINDSRFFVTSENRIMEKPGEEGATPVLSLSDIPESKRDTQQKFKRVNPELSKHGSMKLCFSSEKWGGTQ
jgi:hypothetical protein